MSSETNKLPTLFQTCWNYDKRTFWSDPVWIKHLLPVPTPSTDKVEDLLSLSDALAPLPKMVDPPSTSIGPGKSQPLADQNRSGWGQLWLTAYGLGEVHKTFVKNFGRHWCAAAVVDTCTKYLLSQNKPWEYLSLELNIVNEQEETEMTEVTLW